MNRRFLEVNLRVQGTANDSASTDQGIQFIVGPDPKGHFAGARPNDIAQYLDGRWVFYTPYADSLEIQDLEAAQWKRFNGTEWEPYAPIGGDGVGDALPDASYTVKGKVVVAPEGGLKVVAGSLALGQTFHVAALAVDAGMASDQEAYLEPPVASGMERQVSVSFCGVAQTPMTDFIVVEVDDAGVRKSLLSWQGRGMESIGVAEGDVIVVSYAADAH